MARNIVPTELRVLLNTKLTQEGWASVRNFCLSTGLCTPDTYSAETITRVFNARDGEIKGTEIHTIANVLRYLNTPIEEIRTILEQYYPDPAGRMFWSLLGPQEAEMTALDRSLLEILQSVRVQKPEKMAGLVAAIDSYTQAIEVDCDDAIYRIKKLLKKGE